MGKKWVNYSLLAFIVCIIFWTIYANLFQTDNQSIAIGSYDIENIEEKNSDFIIERDYIDEESEVHNHEEHNDEHEHDGHSHEINTTEVVAVSNQAPNFVTKTLDGETVGLSDFLGKKVIINFWTTWCPPCQDEIPELQEFYENTNENDEVVLLGLNITNQDLGIDVIHDFRDYYGITYPILLDETGQITENYEILSIPTTYIIDENGNLEKQILGPLTKDMLDELLTET